MMRGSDGVLEILNTLKSLILLDVKSLMGVLVWGDFALAAFSFSYHKFHNTSGEKNQIMKFGAELESEVPVCKINFRFSVSLARLNSCKLSYS